MKGYGTERKDKLTCKWGCCMMKDNIDRYKNPNMKRPILHRAKARARQQAKNEILFAQTYDC